jgi:hypothetical protein
MPAPYKCRKYNFHGVPLHTKLMGCTRDGRDNIKQFIKYCKIIGLKSVTYEA